MGRSRIAVVGATGVVGREVLSSLAERHHPMEEVRAFASEQSAVESGEYGAADIEIRPYTPAALSGCGVVVVATNDAVARDVLSAAKAVGATAIDLSGSRRLDATVPLYCPGLNEATLASNASGVVAIASPLSQAVCLALDPLRRSHGLSTVAVSALVGAARAGKEGVAALEAQTVSLLNAREPEGAGPFPHRLAFNVIPQSGPLDAHRSLDERTLMLESARLFGGGVGPVRSTVFLVPAFHGATLSVVAELRRPIDRPTVVAALKSAAGLKVLGEDDERAYPMPMLLTGDDTVHVGRIRVDGTTVELVLAVDLGLKLAVAAAVLAQSLAGTTHLDA